MGMFSAFRGAKKVIQISPGRTILLSVLFTIAVGTALLATPIARHKTMPFIDVLFTAVTSTTVTGMLVVPLEQFTFFGQSIILLLAQIGGLGLITMTLFLISFFVDLGIATQWMAGQVLELDAWQNVRRILVFIILATFTFEALGAIGTFLCIARDHPSPGHAAWISIFHSVTVFCNAGMTLLPGQSMQLYLNNTPLLIISALLMLSGGIGFIAWHELLQRLKPTGDHRRRRLSLHTRLVLVTTLVLVIGSLTTWSALEWNGVFAGMPLGKKIINVIFNAISCRGPGFYTVHIPALHVATLLVIMISSFIGSSPGSTGSGIKTTTFAIFLATVRAAITGRTSVELLGRRLASDQVHKALAVISLSLTWVAVATFCLLISETEFQFLPLLFEVVSAFATLGISMNVTTHLTMFGKIIVMLSMIIGRIGSLTIMLALRKRHIDNAEYSYPEERVMIS